MMGVWGVVFFSGICVFVFFLRFLNFFLRFAINKVRFGEVKDQYVIKEPHFGTRLPDL
jgi:hypothetical protein